jgi:hypothetical protein
LNDAWKSGFSLHFGLERPLWLINAGGTEMAVSGRGDVGLASFGLDATRFGRAIGAPGASIDGGRLMAVSALVSLKIGPTFGNISPYLLGGLGLTSFKIDDFKVNGHRISGIELKDALAHNIGIGFDYILMPGIRLVAEKKFVRTTGGDAFSPLHIGVVLR